MNKSEILIYLPESDLIESLVTHSYDADILENMFVHLN